MTTGELLAFLCDRDESDSEAVTVLSLWLAESRRFHDFAVEYRNKIRKKLRTAGTPEGMRSVLLELEVARRFLEDRGCMVEYERYGQGTVRAADLTVIHRTRTMVNIEVTYIQSIGAEPPDWEGKLIGVVCRKLGQMTSDSPNLLVMAAESGSLAVEDVGAAMKRLKGRAERGDPGIMMRFGFAGAADFFKQFRRLSGIVVWRSEGSGAGLWANPEARHPIPAPFAAMLSN